MGAIWPVQERSVVHDKPSVWVFTKILPIQILPIAKCGRWTEENLRRRNQRNQRDQIRNRAQPQTGEISQNRNHREDPSRSLRYRNQINLWLLNCQICAYCYGLGESNCQPSGEVHHRATWAICWDRGQNQEDYHQHRISQRAERLSGRYSYPGSREDQSWDKEERRGVYLTVRIPLQILTKINREPLDNLQKTQRHRRHGLITPRQDRKREEKVRIRNVRVKVKIPETLPKHLKIHYHLPHQQYDCQPRQHHVDVFGSYPQTKRAGWTVAEVQL